MVLIYILMVAMGIYILVATYFMSAYMKAKKNPGAILHIRQSLTDDGFEENYLFDFQISPEEITRSHLIAVRIDISQN